MGRHYVASVLISITGSEPVKVADVELKPITPGAWAAWAKEDEPMAAATAVKPAEAPVVVAAALRATGAEA